MTARILSLLLMSSLSLHAVTRVVEHHSEGDYPTIQAAVDAAEPGDVIEIRSGVYHERVHIQKGGTAERPLVVRGAPNGFVLINAGQPLKLDWTPVAGLPEVFSAPVKNGVLTADSGLWEMPSRLRLASMSSLEQVAARLGSWHYDAEAGRLYLRGTGRAPAPELQFWLEAQEPAVKVTAPFVEIRNLQATLGQHGFFLTGKQTSHVTVENCRAFCNSQEGIYVSGDFHRILRNETFENNARGIQLLYGVNYGLISGNLSYLNGPNNGETTGGLVDMGMHGLGDFTVFEGNVVDGIHEDTFRYKTARGSNPTTVIRRNVIRGNQTMGTINGVYGNTMLVSGLGMRQGMYRNGGRPGPMRSWENVDPDGLQRALNLIHPLVQQEDPHFADSAYRDYRLQGDSPYLGHGAYPGIAPVFYVDPARGRDGNTGLSLSDPLSTPEAALRRLPAGGTLYLLPGNYSEPIILTNGGLSEKEPLRIRAYGKQEGIVIAGGLQIMAGGLENKGRHFVEIEGLEFHSRLSLEKSAGTRVLHCVFAGKESGIAATDSPRLRVDRCTFSENKTAIALEKSPDACVVQNVFTKCGQLVQADETEFFSAFNAFDSADARLGGQQEKITLAPNFAAPSQGPLAMAAADFGFVGARQESLASQWEITNLRVAGLSPQGATLLWETPRQATFAEITLEGGGEKRTWQPEYWLQILGTSFDITRLMDAFYSSQRHAVLPDLKPDTAYKMTLVPIDREGRRGEPERLEFRTPARYQEAAVYYISPEGNDASDGLSARTPWKSFAHATAQLAPGDELVLLPGIYRETLRPRVSGTAERPITLRSAGSQKAVLDLSEGLPVAVEILNADHLIVDGLLISGGTFPRSHCYLINHARGITIRNGAVDWHEGASFEKLKLGYQGVIAHAAPNLRVEHNLFLTCVAGVAASHAPGSVIRNNTIVGEGNYGVVILAASAEDSYTVENNIFYRATLGYKTNPAIWVFAPMPQLVSDYNLFYIPEEHKGTIGELPGTERLFPLKAWVEATGLDRNSMAAQPEFAAPEKLDFTLKAGSPGKGAASDGGDVGK